MSVDKILIERLKKGDKKAFEQIYDRYWQQLFIAANNRLRSEETAKEIVQELFINLWQRKKELSINHTFAAYIHTALRYSILDFIRSQKVKERYIEAIKKTAESHSNSTNDLVYYNDLRNRLNQEVNKLPERCRVAFQLNRFEHYTSKEIAKKMNISSKTVDNQIGKALKILRTNLKEYLTFWVSILITLTRIG